MTLVRAFGACVNHKSRLCVYLNKYGSNICIIAKYPDALQFFIAQLMPGPNNYRKGE